MAGTDDCRGLLRPTGEPALAMSVGQTLTVVVVGQPGIHLSVTPAALVRLRGRVVTAVAAGDILVAVHGTRGVCPPRPPTAPADACPAVRVTIVGRPRPDLGAAPSRPLPAASAGPSR
ncbi:hypothetical protein [Nakamurella endophytica]|uniref:Uncharacterized protein n=1 Tax=Nakamurella endophytica TaxID=1748367 RepID=A0A917SRX0_9ACTN|nr:hypothetical protein [Nakamurella endophytica]GGL94494.1 hypothetical protein GCM10011594_12900 [Nakamurella endophytica]